jgi:hypothetical protein
MELLIQMSMKVQAAEKLYHQKDITLKKIQQDT